MISKFRVSANYDVFSFKVKNDYVPLILIQKRQLNISRCVIGTCSSESSHRNMRSVTVRQWLCVLNRFLMIDWYEHGDCLSD